MATDAGWIGDIQLVEQSTMASSPLSVKASGEPVGAEISRFSLIIPRIDHSTAILNLMVH